MKPWSIFLMFGLFVLILSSFDSAEAGPSTVSLSIDKTSGDILEGEVMLFSVTLDNNDTRYRFMEVYLVAHWVTGVPWNVAFVDSNYHELDSNIIRLGKVDQDTVNFAVFCDVMCSAGDTITLHIYGLTDPKFYETDYGEGEDPGNHTDTCGSADCKNDTSPASTSSNVTNTLIITLNAWTEYESEVVCGNISNTGDSEVFPNNPIQCNYTLTNLGWNTDSYQFTSTLTSPSGQKFVNLQDNISGNWSVSSGMAVNKILTGHSNMSVNAIHSEEGVISILYPNNAAAGVYNFEFGITSANGTRTTNCSFDFTIPESKSNEEVTEDSANETAETITEDENEEVPAISLIPVLVSIGLIAIFRRK